ncbi:MAG: ATPase [Candidatus Altiarchaeota archaeon]|nr:ATPase [Candidatus Altiarchaeota archaeon]
MERVSTGIAGLDEMLNGGFIQGRPYVVIGTPGAGKTIFGMQFLMEGVKNKERGFYVSLEESSEELIANMNVFGWDLQSIKILDTSQELGSDKWLIKTDTIVAKPEFSLGNLLRVMREKMQTYKPRRIVIDSMTSIKMLYEKNYDMRRGLLSLMNFLFRADATTILTSTCASQNLMEESLASGIIKLHKLENKGEMVTGISVEKMRGSDFDKHIRPYKITDKGIVVFPNETLSVLRDI